MSDIKRYRLSDGFGDAEEIEDPAGKYVRYEDHIAVVKETKKEVAGDCASFAAYVYDSDEMSDLIEKKYGLE